MPVPVFQPYVPGASETVENRIKNLTNAYYETTEQLLWLLSHLDEKNVLKAKSVIADWIYTNTITTDQLIAGTAKISLALIENIQAQTLYAVKGYIADLTVDQLDTSDKVRNYLNSDTSDVNYIRIHDQHIEFITANTDGSQSEQLLDRDGNPIYWADDTYTGTTLDVTDYPVMVYVYTELTKMVQSFEEVDGVKIPRLVFGAGSGNPEHPDREKGFIYKDTNGLLLKYIKSDDTEAYIRVGENGIEGLEGAGGTASNWGGM